MYMYMYNVHVVLRCVQILLLLTRVMDDVKNFERDKIAHPDK